LSPSPLPHYGFVEIQGRLFIQHVNNIDSDAIHIFNLQLTDVVIKIGKAGGVRYEEFIAI
jgi:hypothetical protein